MTCHVTVTGSLPVSTTVVQEGSSPNQFDNQHRSGLQLVCADQIGWCCMLEWVDTAQAIVTWLAGPQPRDPLCGVQADDAHTLTGGTYEQPT